MLSPSSSRFAPSHMALLFFVTLTLLLHVAGGEERKPVGFFKHKFNAKGEIYKLGANKTATTQAQIDAGYKGEAACEVTINAAKDIILHYGKGRKGNAVSKGCTVDLLVREQGDSIKFFVGANQDGGLGKACLKDFGKLDGQVYGFEGMGDYNLVPIAFNANEDQFKSFSDGPLHGGDHLCGDKSNCVDTRNGKCLQPANFGFGFATASDQIVLTMMALGDPRSYYCNTIFGGNENSAHAEVELPTPSGKREIFRICGLDDVLKGMDICIKRDTGFRRPELLKIVDPDLAAEGTHRKLLTVHLLPQGATKKRNDKGDKIIGSHLNGGPTCQELIVKFPASSYKMLVAETPGETGPVPPPLLNGTVPPSGPEAVTTPKEESSGMLLIVIIVVVVLILAVVGGVLVWLFVLKGKDGEGEDGAYTMGATTGAGTTKATTMAGTTVGATQAKTAGGTTMGATVGATQAKTAGATTMGGTKAGGKTTAAGGKTTAAGGKTTAAGGKTAAAGTKAGGGTTKK